MKTNTKQNILNVLPSLETAIHKAPYQLSSDNIFLKAERFVRNRKETSLAKIFKYSDSA